MLKPPSPPQPAAPLAAPAPAAAPEPVAAAGFSRALGQAREAEAPQAPGKPIGRTEDASPDRAVGRRAPDSGRPDPQGGEGKAVATQGKTDPDDVRVERGTKADATAPKTEPVQADPSQLPEVARALAALAQVPPPVPATPVASAVPTKEGSGQALEGAAAAAPALPVAAEPKAGPTPEPVETTPMNQAIPAVAKAPQPVGPAPAAASTGKPALTQTVEGDEEPMPPMSTRATLIPEAPSRAGEARLDQAPPVALLREKVAAVVEKAQVAEAHPTEGKAPVPPSTTPHPEGRMTEPVPDPTPPAAGEDAKSPVRSPRAERATKAPAPGTGPEAPAAASEPAPTGSARPAPAVASEQGEAKIQPHGRPEAPQAPPAAEPHKEDKPGPAVQGTSVRELPPPTRRPEGGVDVSLPSSPATLVPAQPAGMAVPVAASRPVVSTTPEAVHAPASPAPPPPLVAQVDGSIRWILKQQQQSAELQLHPESLGKVVIQLRVEGQDVHARVWASEPSTLPIIQEHRAFLEVSLRDQGLNLGSFDLQQGQQGRNAEEAEARRAFVNGVSRVTEPVTVQDLPGVPVFRHAETGRIEVFA